MIEKIFIKPLYLQPFHYHALSSLEGSDGTTGYPSGSEMPSGAGSDGNSSAWTYLSSL